MKNIGVNSGDRRGGHGLGLGWPVILLLAGVFAFEPGCVSRSTNEERHDGFSFHAIEGSGANKVYIPLAIDPKDYHNVKCVKNDRGEWVVPDGYCKTSDEVRAIRKETSNSEGFWEVVGGAIVTSLGAALIGLAVWLL
jgi:hypothetical protein